MGFVDPGFVPLSENSYFVPLGIGMIFICIIMMFMFLSIVFLDLEHGAIQEVSFGYVYYINTRLQTHTHSHTQSTHRYVLPILIRMIRTGNKVNIKDVPRCPRADNPVLQANRMRELLKTHSAFVSYVYFVWPCMRAGIFLSAMSLGAVFLQAIANRNVVIYLQHRYYNSTTITRDEEVEGYTWSFLVPFLTLCASLFGQHSMMFGKFAARRAYAAFCTLLFEKPSKITTGALGALEEGTVLNMMSVDCLSVANITMFLQFASTAFIMIAASSAQILYELGVIGIPAIALLVVMSFVNKRIGDKAKVLTMKKNQISDKRNVKLNEAISGMRTVKLYAWVCLIYSHLLLTHSLTTPTSHTGKHH